ncbi:MAG: DUF4147 domain-containing protein, partial [Deltaproteobacteria bacterium]|nr:DUF4147 domain-containing protein [Nannocystaceae bacterium]
MEDVRHLLGVAMARTVIGGTAMGDDAAAILQAVMHASDPVAWIERNVVAEGRGVRIGGRLLVPDPGGVMRILGIGKAAPSMVSALLARIGDQVDEALAIGKHGGVIADPRLIVRTAGHPLPDAESVA